MEGDESAVPRAAELQLRHCLDARTRRWVAAEFFCSAIDRPWFLHNPMQARRGRPVQAWAAAARPRPAPPVHAAQGAHRLSNPPKHARSPPQCPGRCAAPGALAWARAASPRAMPRRACWRT